MIRSQHVDSSPVSLALALSLCSLLGCGSGGTKSGSFTDIALIGLAYETDTVRGVTDADGFEYNDGETIRFSIGSTILGTLEAKSEMSIFDLVPGAEPLVGLREVSGIVQDRSGGPCVPFERVMNIATLLQTFDANDDISDGVEISPGAAALFDGVLLNLDKPMYEFRNERNFRRALNTANAANLFTAHRQVQVLSAVADAIYDGAGVDPQLFSASLIETDRDGDNVIDETETYTYDDRSFRVREARDNDAMGDPSFVYESTYDEYGRTTLERYDENGDGVFDGDTTHEFDVDGNLIATTFRLQPANTVMDSSTREYNDFGDETVRRSDSDGDGIVNSEWRTLYDDEGRQIESTLDRGADGTIELREITRYNADGLVDRFTSDDGDDGRLERIMTSEYNEGGLVIRTVNERIGVGTNTAEFGYDADGNRTSLRLDNDGDGTVDRIQLDTYEAPGRWILQETDNDGNGILDRIRTRTYNDAGDLLTSIDDSDADGMPDFVARYETNEFGNRTLRENDSGADGSIDFVERTTLVKTGWAAYLIFGR